MPSPSLDEILTGTTLHERYRIGPPLGRGGMGVVYRAHDLLLDRPVAVKVIGDDALADDPGRERWLREARASARLQHPHVVAVFDAGIVGQRAFIVMELVEGATLREVGPGPLPEVLLVARQLCSALAHAHAHGVVHRDLKPENVLIVREPAGASVKLADLGVAWMARGTRLTREGSLVGTAEYLAPEQILGGELDGRADLYALGVMLYELVTGRVPFAGDDVLAVVSQHLHAPVVPPRTFRADLPARLEAVILRCLAKDREQRFATAMEVDAELAQIAGAAPADGAAPASSAPILDQLTRGRLVGRRDEVETLRQLWLRAMEGRSHLALVSGEPGVGKTRLARELIAAARLHGAEVLQGGCYEFEAITPYLPFVEAIRQWVRGQSPDGLRLRLGETAGELARLAPEITAKLGAQPPAASLAPHEERLRLFDAVTRFFQGVARERGVMLFLDDLHWADHGSLALLHYLVRNLREDRLLVLGAYREVELGRSHPLGAALVDWERERLSTRVALGRLSRDDTDRLLAALLGQEGVAPDLAEALFRETEGNPFFAEEVVKSLIEQELLVREASGWRRRDSQELAIPQSVKAAIGRRLQRLSPACAEALNTAAGLGKQFDFSELAAASTLTEEQLLDAMDEAAGAQLVRSQSGDRFAFTHDKIREVLHEDLNPVRQRRLHLRIAEGLERLHAGDLEAHAATLAYHFAESTDLRRGLTYSIAAAEAAEKIYAHDEALSLLDRARECADALEDTARLAAVESAIGRVFTAQGTLPDAITHYERALALTRDPGERAILKGRLGEAHARTGDPRGPDFLREALEVLDPVTQTGERARALGNFARYHHYRAEHGRAVEYLEQARALAEPLGDGDLLEVIYGFLAGAYQHLGRFEDSIAWARRSIEIGERTQAPNAIAMGHEFIAEASSNQGDWELALASADADRAFGKRSGSMDRIAWGGMSRAWALWGTGRLRESADSARQDLELARRIGEGRLAVWLSCVLSIALVDLGETEEARSLAEWSVAQARTMDQIVMRSAAARAISQLHIHAGDWQAVLDAAFADLELSETTDNRISHFLVGPDVAEALVRLDRREEAARWIERSLQVSRDSRSGPCLARLLTARGLLRQREGRVDDAEQDFAEAIATHERQGSRLYLARALRVRGEARRARGEAAGAREDLARALELFAACEAAPERDATRRELDAAG
jgi:tetratricopeptide (TPR) repeat protein